MYESGDDWFYVKPVTEIAVGSKKLDFASVEWDVRNFSRRARRADEEIISPNFSCGDASWMLSVFPNGERRNGTVGNVDISLRKDSTDEVIAKVVSEIIIVRNDDSRVFLVKGEILFHGNRGSSWPRAVRLPRSDVLRKDYAYLKGDTMTIICNLFVLLDERLELSSIAIAKNIKGEKTSGKKDAGTNTSSKDFGNLCLQNLHRDTPTETEHNLTLISKDFEAMYNNQRFADVVLKLGKHEFPAHKLILRSRSKVFEAMFEHDMQENRQDTVDLVDMEVHTVRDMLRYIYCGKVRGLSPDEALNVYVAADRYDLQELVLHCRKIILDTLSVDNLCEVSAVADLHNDHLLTDEVKSILCKNMKEVLKTDKGSMFAKENPMLSLSLMRSAILNE